MSLFLPEDLQRAVHDLSALVGNDLTLSFNKTAGGLLAIGDDIKVSHHFNAQLRVQATVDGESTTVSLSGVVPSVKTVRVIKATLIAHLGHGVSSQCGFIFVRPLRGDFTDSRLYLVSGRVAGYDDATDLLTQLELGGNLLRTFMPDTTRWIQC